MAAILNPPALQPTTRVSNTRVSNTPSRSTLATHAELAESLLDRSAPVAPWNRAEARNELRPVRHLRLVTEPVPVPVVARRRPLRVLLAGLGLAALVAFAAIGVLPFLGADAAAVSPASSADTTGPAVVDAPPASTTAAAPVQPAASPAPIDDIVVQAGDSLWTVARRLQPRGDLRQLVDRLIERVGGTSVTRGQHINVSGLLD
jgi:nucleoid-associated protein YgaU